MTIRLLRALSFLAIWPGLYSASAVIYILQLTDQTRPSLAIIACFLMAFLTGVGTYLLDRVKARDSWLDPADDAAHPARFEFIARRSGVIRRFAIVVLALAAIIPLAYAWIAPPAPRWRFAGLAAIPILSALGVLAYAARPRRRRPRVKDVLLLKNMYVAAGITGFAVVLARAWAADGAVAASAWPAWVLAALTLLGRVIADAVLCDLDDQTADAAFGTSTLPTVLGRARAWNSAVTLRLLLALGLATVPVGPAAPRLAWAAMTAISTVALRLSGPRTLRDWVDSRFALEAAATTIILNFSSF